MQHNIKSQAKELIEKIDDPDDPHIQDLFNCARKDTKKAVEGANIPNISEGVIRRLSYTYYYDWETDEPDYMFLTQDPGNLDPRHFDELQGTNPIANGCSYRDQIHLYRQFGKSWLIHDAPGKNGWSERFFPRLHQRGLIELNESWDEYIQNERIFNDFYLGDVSNYRCNDFKADTERPLYNCHLKKEIQALNPKLIFAFGTRSWDTIRKYTDIQKISDKPVVPSDRSSIKKVHGVLYEMNNPIDCYVVPLTHPSRWQFSAKKSMRLLDEGLTDWKNTIE